MLNANDLSSYGMYDNMCFNNRFILNICQLSFHICFQKQKLSPRQKFDEWVIVSPKLKICWVALMCCRKAGLRLRDTKCLLQETSLQVCDVPGSSLTALLVRLLVKCLMSQEVTPGCTKIINSMHLGKILIPVTNFEAVIGYMLD